MSKDDLQAPSAGTLRKSLGPEDARALENGEHEPLAARLRAAGKSVLAGLVLEEIWAFDAAARDFLRGAAPLHALRAALEARDPALFEEVLVALENTNDPPTLERAAALLGKRSRNVESARLLARAQADPHTRAEALERAGDRLGAARALSEAGNPRGALTALGTIESADGAGFALAAKMWWELGDAEQAARSCQRALRADHDEAGLRPLLAAALAALGHDVAAQVVLEHLDPHARERVPGARGRYHVTGVLPAALAGATYVGVDRVSLEDVEIHLLLADQGERLRPEPEVRAALATFAATAEAAARLDHPAIRPILHLDATQGVVVLPRAAGAPLRNLIRKPGMAATPARARSMARFLLEGLAAAHANGLVHGGVLPSRVLTDEVGRPLLGPFGAHFLAGLAATHTGGLEEVLLATAPEVRRGETPGPAADVYAVAATTTSLLLGTLSADPSRLHELVDEDLSQPLEAALQDDPALRPSARALAAALDVVVPDVSRLGTGPDPEDSGVARAMTDSWLGERIGVQAAPTWSDAELDALASSSAPRLQTIFDREGRRFELASWPEECRRLPAGTDPASIVDLELVDDPAGELRGALARRLRTDCVVMTAAGDWMLALDVLLTR